MRSKADFEEWKQAELNLRYEERESLLAEISYLELEVDRMYREEAELVDRIDNLIDSSYEDYIKDYLEANNED